MPLITKTKTIKPLHLISDNTNKIYLKPHASTRSKTSNPIKFSYLNTNIHFTSVALIMCLRQRLLNHFITYKTLVYVCMYLS